MCLGLVKEQTLILQYSIVALQRDLLLFVLLRSRLLGFHVLLALIKFRLGLPNLLLDDDELTLLVFQSLRELIDLTLETVRLWLEVGAHSTVTALRHAVICRLLVHF